MNGFFNISKLEITEKINQYINDAIDNKVKSLTGLYGYVVDKLSEFFKVPTPELIKLYGNSITNKVRYAYHGKLAFENKKNLRNLIKEQKLNEETGPDWRIKKTIDVNLIKFVKPQYKKIYEVTLEIVKKIFTNEAKLLNFEPGNEEEVINKFCDLFKIYAEEYNFKKIILETGGFTNFDFGDNMELYLYDENTDNVVTVFDLYWEKGEYTYEKTGRDTSSGPAESFGSIEWFLSLEFNNDIFIEKNIKNKEIIYRYYDNF